MPASWMAIRSPWRAPAKHAMANVVARLGDEVTVKRFQRTPKGITLLPENPDFEPIVVSSDHPDFELEGLAVGLIRNQPLN